MIRIYCGGENITYTAGDTFELDITTAGGFEQGTTLNFQIAQNEQSESVINKLFDLKSGCFEVVLSGEETEKLAIGNYIFKLTVIDSGGKISTEKSGELTVKWGA